MTKRLDFPTDYLALGQRVVAICDRIRDQYPHMRSLGVRLHNAINVDVCRDALLAIAAASADAPDLAEEARAVEQRLGAFRRT